MQAWQANIDIQPVFNRYTAVTYMCTYFSKAEDEKSEAMKQTVKFDVNGKKSDFERMKTIHRPYATKRECSVQEAVYLVIKNSNIKATVKLVKFSFFPSQPRKVGWPD